MKSIKFLTLLTGLIFSLKIDGFAQELIQNIENERVFIGENLEYFVDSTKKMTFDELKGRTFLKCPTEILNLGNTESSVWMRFTVASQTQKEVFLEISAPLLSKIEIFEVNNGVPNQIFNGGSLLPFKNRPIAGENWVFNLKIPEAGKSTIYIKGESIYPFQVPISLSSKNKILEYNQLNTLFWGLYMGVMIFAFFYNLFIYLSVKERIYLYYLLYIVFSVTFYLGLEGFAFQFIWPNYPSLNQMIPICVGLTNIFITLFTFRLFRINKDQKALFYGGYAVIAFNAFSAILNIAGLFVVALSLSQLISLLGCIYFIISGVISLRRGISSAKYFLIAWSAFLVLVVLFILALNNVVPSNFLTTHGIFFGHMTEVLLLSIALADRINALKAENEKKQNEIIVQFKENQLLQTKVNRELEQKVNERTSELMAEKKEVEKQKKRSDDLLLNILPEEVAEELKTKGSAEAQLMDKVTVLFTDFKDFTQYSEKLTPKELVSEINECFSAFDLIVEKFGVEKIKTIGDAYMAAGGLPTKNITHASDVLNAAMEISEYMKNHNLKMEAEGKMRLDIRIGVHSGPVVAGIVGVKKFAYDIWGDTVNTASRMENSGEIGKVNISGSTYELVKDQYNCVYRGRIAAKGKGEIDMYFVESKI